MNTDRIASSFHLVDHYILKFNMSNFLPSFLDEDLTSKTFDVDYDVHGTTVDDGRRFGYLVLRINVDLLSAKSQEDSRLNRTCNIHLEMQGVFSDSADVSEKDFVRMLSLNGTGALYSIARSVLISLSSLAVPTGTIRLPLINVFSIKAEKETIDRQRVERAKTKITQGTVSTTAISENGQKANAHSGVKAKKGNPHKNTGNRVRGSE